MAESTPTQSSSAAAVHIVYTEKPQDEEPEAYHIRTLASVLGSEDAAKEALIYSYKNAASGFSAKLTSDQVSRISEGVGLHLMVKETSKMRHLLKENQATSTQNRVQSHHLSKALTNFVSSSKGTTGCTPGGRKQDCPAACRTWKAEHVKL